MTRALIHVRGPRGYREALVPCGPVLDRREIGVRVRGPQRHAAHRTALVRIQGEDAPRWIEASRVAEEVET